MNTKRLSAMAAVLAVAMLFAQAAFASSGAEVLYGIVTDALNAGNDPQSVIDDTLSGETPADQVEAVARAAVDSGKVSADDIAGMLSHAGVSKDIIDSVLASISGDSSLGMGAGSHDSADTDGIPGGGAGGGGGGASSPR